MTDSTTLDTVMVRTNKHSGAVTATIYTTDNDFTDGCEGSGLNLVEALHDLADSVEQALDEKAHCLITLVVG